MTLRAGTMRLACMFSSILLFGAAGLLLFISLQDSTELTPQQVPGEPSHWPRRPLALQGCPGARSVLRPPSLLLAGISLNVGTLCLMLDY